MRAVPQAIFMALSFGILLFALYFIGSVVIEAALPSASHGGADGNSKGHQFIGGATRSRQGNNLGKRTHVQSLDSIEGSAIRGRPAGGSALDASLKKGAIDKSIDDDDDPFAGTEEEEETHFADRIRNNALALTTSSWERLSRSNPPDNVPKRPRPMPIAHTPSADDEDDGDDAEEEEEAAVPGKSINYNLKPELFTATISECLLDEQCRIIYHHVGKSGGTTLEDTFFHMYPPKHSSCCGSKLLGRLANYEESRKTYCTAKFSSYQIIGAHVPGLVKSCMRINSMDGLESEGQNTSSTNGNIGKDGRASQQPRSVVLTTYRDPISRTLSSIHQLCNKQSKKRTNETLEACNECRYDFGTAVWDRVANMTNEHYEGVAEVASLRIPGVQVISLDMVDISPALDRLRERLPLDAKKSRIKGVPVVPVPEWRNPERKSVCSFAMPSEMIKSLGIAQAVYRNLTAGFL